MIPLVDLGAQHRELAAELEAAFRAAMSATAFIGGEEVRCFEEEFAAFCQVRHAIALASGTDALWLSLLALGIGPGDEVATVAFTFAATAEAIIRTGAQVRFVDVDPATGTMDPAALDATMTARTRAVMPVHLYGQPADMRRIQQVADWHGAAVVEDACQAHGATYQGEPAGALGDAACFSFYPTKNLGACGDGGAVTTRSGEIAERLRLLRDHGQRRRYEYEVVGWNSRLDALQAAILRRKLPHLARWNEARQRHVATYRELLADVPGLVLPEVRPGSTHAYHLFVVRARERERLRAELPALGVEVGVHYPLPLHRSEAFAEAAAWTELPETERWAAEALSLPLYPELTLQQIEHVASAVRRVLTGVPMPR